MPTEAFFTSLQQFTNNPALHLSVLPEVSLGNTIRAEVAKGRLTASKQGMPLGELRGGHHSACVRELSRSTGSIPPLAFI